MKKRSLQIILSFAVTLSLAAALSGCEITAVTDGKSEASDDAGNEQPEDNDGKKSDSDKKSATLSEYLEMECVNQKMKLSDNDYEAAEGTCYRFALDDDTARDYPELAVLIDEINDEAYSDFDSDMDLAASGAIQRHLEEWEYPFEVDATATVTRADSKAFSYSVNHYSFLGGAHGYTYFSARAVDPVTCKDIRFSDVVTDTSDFPDICYEELIAQNDYLEEYFEASASDKDNLLERIREDADSKDGPVWSLSYEGITIYFEDYSMGSYAAGCATVDIPYKAHKEIFNNKYFKFKGSVPDIKDHVKTKDVTDDIIEAEPLNRIINVGYDWDRDFYSDGMPYMTAWTDKLVIIDDLPELKARVDSINKANVKSVKSGFKDYTVRTKKQYEKDHGNDDSDVLYRDLKYGIYQYLTRADQNVFSSVEAHREDISEEYGERKLIGINIDPKTGDDISLEEVVTDISDLRRAFKKAVKAEHYPDDTEADIISEFKKQTAGADLVSHDELSWTIGYTGITFYCNTLCNYALGDMQNDAFVIFISFADEPDLFEKKYTKVPASYAYQIPVCASFPGHAFIDMTYDTAYTPLGISVRRNEYGEFDNILFAIDSSWNDAEGYYGTELYATVVKEPMGSTYVYIQLDREDGYPDLHIYSFDGKKVTEITEKHSPGYEIDYISSGDKNDPSGRILTDPVRMRIRDTDDTMGARDVYADCCIDMSGFPVSKDGYWYYRKDPSMDLKAKQDIKLDKGSIPGGSTVTPLRVKTEPDISDEADMTGDITYTKVLELQGKDNRIYTLDIEYDKGYWKYKGTSLEDMFDGYFIFPG